MVRRGPRVWAMRLGWQGLRWLRARAVVPGRRGLQGLRVCPVPPGRQGLRMRSVLPGGLGARWLVGLAVVGPVGRVRSVDRVRRWWVTRGRRRCQLWGRVGPGARVALEGPMAPVGPAISEGLGALVFGTGSVVLAIWVLPAGAGAPALRGCRALRAACVVGPAGPGLLVVRVGLAVPGRRVGPAVPVRRTGLRRSAVRALRVSVVGSAGRAGQGLLPVGLVLRVSPVGQAARRPRVGPAASGLEVLRTLRVDVLGSAGRAVLGLRVGLVVPVRRRRPAVSALRAPRAGVVGPLNRAVLELQVGPAVPVRRGSPADSVGRVGLALRALRVGPALRVG
ncbi:hypothetical protein GCM10010252_17420 [Streptomyces aureoverticillatus]|nr:hypothetical protein GCM10010252_17420 [Streptomyces aureoverticillatus]